MPNKRDKLLLVAATESDIFRPEGAEPCVLWLDQLSGCWELYTEESHIYLSPAASSPRRTITGSFDGFCLKNNKLTVHTSSCVYTFTSVFPFSIASDTEFDPNCVIGWVTPRKSPIHSRPTWKVKLPRAQGEHANSTKVEPSCIWRNSHFVIRKTNKQTTNYWLHVLLEKYHHSAHSAHSSSLSAVWLCD